MPQLYASSLFAIALCAIASLAITTRRRRKSQTRRPRICVFCGSRSGSKPEYAEQARYLGKLMAERGIDLVYGGGNIGLMGEIARAVDESGGSVFSVIPKALVPFTGRIIQQDRCIVTGGMHERKRKFVELADAFIALPGGLGTIEELCETATWRQLGVHYKPFGVLNICGFFAPLRQVFETAISEGFLGEEWEDGGIIFEQNAPVLLDRIMKKIQGDDEKSKALIASHEWVI